MQKIIIDQDETHYQVLHPVNPTTRTGAVYVLPKEDIDKKIKGGEDYKFDLKTSEDV